MDTKPDISPRRPNSRIRRLLVIATALVALTCAALLIATRGPVAKFLILSRIESLTNARIDFDSAVIHIDGTIEINSLSVTSPSIVGTAGQVLQARNASITLTGLLTGHPSPQTIRIDHPVVRIAQDIESGTINLATIQLKSRPSASSTPPKLTASNGTLEIGEYTGSDYHILRSLPVVASLQPATNDTYSFTLRHDADGESFKLVGNIFPDRTEITIDELDLAAWPTDAFPSRLRSLFQTLALKGKILPTSLTITSDGQVQLHSKLDGVELQLPLDQAPLARGHMTDVQGSLHIDQSGVHAQLHGKLDSVPATATLHANRLDPDSPFTCNITIGRVQLAQNLDRLGYIPDFVREQLEIFSNPTAEIALKLNLQRQNDSSDINATGIINLFNGVASYRDFPYEFTNISATFELDKDTLFLRKLDGSAPSGARIEATGEIGPLGPTAEATLDIKVTRVPLNPQLRNALGPKYHELYDTLLSREAYQQLLNQSLVQTPRKHRERVSQLEKLKQLTPSTATRKQIRELERQVKIPAFILGGRGTVNIHIHRHEGIENIWDSNISVFLPHAGFLPRQFPVPILANDVTINIVDNKATLDKSDGTFQTLAGGSATIQALAQLDHPEALPHITIEATDIPISPLLVNAIPGNPAPDQSALDARTLLNHLGLEGTIDSTAKIGWPDQPAFLISVRPRSITANIDDWKPTHGNPSSDLALAKINGTILATPTRLDLNLTASLNDRSAPASNSPLSLQTSIDYSPESPAVQIKTMDAQIENLDLNTPIEQLVALIDEPAAEQLNKLRNQYNPTGQISINLTQQNRNPDSTPVTTVQLTDARDATIQFKDTDLTLSKSLGTVTLTRGNSIGISFNDFGGPVLFNHEPLGKATIKGEFHTAQQAEPAPVFRADTETITVSLTDGSFNTSLLERLLPADSKNLRNVLKDLQPQASCDLLATLGVSTSAAQLQTLQIHPHSLALTRNEQPIHLNISQGFIEVVDSIATLHSIHLKAESWAGMLDGHVSAPDPETLDADIEFSLDADSLTPDLRAVLPETIRTVLENLSIQVAGPIRLSQAHLMFSYRPDAQQLDTLGHIDLTNASAEIGIKIDQMNAGLDFVAHTAPALENPDFEIRINAPTLRASGIWMSNASITIRSTADGAILAAPITADAHNGRVSASAVVWQGKDQTTRYDLKTSMSAVRFAPVLVELAQDTETPDINLDSDDSRGVLDGRFALFGMANGPRYGSGYLQVSQGQVLKLPLIVPLIEVGNLQPPTNEQLELARTRFYLQNDQVTFEDLTILSKSIELIGYGTMNIPDQSIDLRVNSRSSTRIPVFSSLFEGLRDELVTLQVRGTLKDPQVSTKPLSNTRAAIGSLFGRHQTEQEKQLREIKRRAFEYRNQTRLSSKQIHEAVEKLNKQDNNQDQ